jgi:putative redox protein
VETDCEKQMVICENEEARYRVVISNGKHEISADTSEDNGGGGSAIRPHELLEAAFASCLNMTIRIYADKANIPLTGVTTKVSTDRTQPGKTIFKYSFSIEGTLTNEQREELNRGAEECLVKKTLLSTIDIIKAL